MSFINRYIEVDSSFRDRTNYPNPGDFVVSPTPVRITAAEAHDPIFEGVPIVSGQIWDPGVGTLHLNNLTFPITATGTIGYSDPIIMGTGYYRGDYVDVWSANGTGASTTIFEFGPNEDQTMATIVMYPPLSRQPDISDFYYIRKRLPDERGIFPDGSTTNLLQLPNTLYSTNTDFYKDKYIFIESRNPVIAGEYSRITNFNFIGGTGYAWIDPPFDAAPVAGDTFDINNFTYDNAGPLRGNNSSLNSGYAEYNIRLLHAIVPGTYIINSTGGLITNYPYVHIELSQAQGSTYSQPIYSNSPFTEKVLFQVYVDGTSYGDFIPLIDCNQTVTIKFNPLAPLHFKLTLPDGTVPIFGGYDNTSPLPPIDKFQVSAFFELTRVS